MACRSAGIALTVFLALALVAAAGEASAHRLRVFASLIGTGVEGEAYFVGGGPAADILVTLRDGADATLASGRTDRSGRFALPAPAAGGIVVVADAQDGHVARFSLAGPAPAPAAAPAAASAGQATAPPGDANIAIARQIAALAEQIDALETSVRLRDIIGGVGYIVGLFGLFAFLKARRRGQGR